MKDLDRALDDISRRGAPRGASVVFERASHGPVVRDASRAPVLVAGAVFIVLAVLAAVALQPSEPPQPVTMELPPLAPVFDAETETVLLFDDGYDGVDALDLDTGTTMHRTIEGHRSGDQPYRLWWTGARLVVGWGSVWSATIDEGPSTKLGDATIFVPALSADSVWLVDYPGGSTGSGAPTLRRVGIDGVVLEDLGTLPSGALPVREVAGGIAYEVADGIEVRDQDGVVSRRFDGRIGDANDSLLAWCRRSCQTIELLDTSTETSYTIEPRDPGFAVNGEAMRFSPDGRLLAVQTGPEIVLIDTASGSISSVVEHALPDSGWLDWAVDGTQLFYASPGAVGRLDVASGESSTKSVDIATAGRFVAVPRSTVPAMLGEPVSDDAVDNLRAGQLSRIPFADPVRLLLGREAWTALGAADARQPQAWDIAADEFAGRTGSFSALRTLAAASQITSIEGPVDHCAGPPLPDPTDFEYDTHIVVQPVLRDASSCLNWFAVEIFLFEDAVVGVTLDLWEP